MSWYICILLLVSLTVHNGYGMCSKKGLHVLFLLPAAAAKWSRVCIQAGLISGLPFTQLWY